ncbi:MAG: TraB/GumN family protein, partial [Sphingomonadales bacterium]|nr:TraB/GumN family protein [Sphingomonadales bacterium]
MKTLRYLIFAGLAAFGGSVAAAAEPPAARPVAGDAGQPAIWLLSDEDTRIWMLGTVHILPSSLDWRSAELDTIIDAVDELVLETDNEVGVIEKPELMTRLMTRDRPLAILDRISPEYRNRYRLMMKDMGLQVGDFDEFETWAVSLMLIVIANVGYIGELPAGEMPSGVEIELSELFDDRDKPILGVETQLDQLG